MTVPVGTERERDHRLDIDVELVALVVRADVAVPVELKGYADQAGDGVRSCLAGGRRSTGPPAPPGAHRQRNGGTKLCPDVSSTTGHPFASSRVQSARPCLAAPRRGVECAAAEMCRQSGELQLGGHVLGDRAADVVDQRGLAAVRAVVAGLLLARDVTVVGSRRGRPRKSRTALAARCDAFPRQSERPAPGPPRSRRSPCRGCCRGGRPGRPRTCAWS